MERLIVAHVNRLKIKFTVSRSSMAAPKNP